VNPKPPVHAPYLAEPTAKFPGAPLAPIGDPMLARVGPGAYVLRHDGPDLMFDDSTPKIVPLRTLPEFSVSPDDPDPRGWKVVGADGIVAGIAKDLWLDKADMLFRFLEVEVPTEAGPRQMMLPIPLMRVDEERKLVRVKSLLAKHFATAPTLKFPDTITVTEEDAAQAYCAAGQLYATRGRSEPLL
jgi:photosynthetic reaction center H subunit